MKPDKRIGKKMMKVERRWLCKGHAAVASAQSKREATRFMRREGKRQCAED